MSMAEATIVSRIDWAEGLWSIGLDTAPEIFVPGQFVNLGLELDGDFVKRSYSLASAASRPADIFLVLVPGGGLTPHLYGLGVGDRLMMSSRGAGFFTLDEVPEARDAWLVCTGTGLAPYLSMMRQGDVFSRFAEVVVVHAVRHASDLAYRDELATLVEQRGLRYVPIVSREDAPGALRGRIPALLSEGQLERRAGLELERSRSHVMLCGNPEMIAETVTALGQRGMKKHRRREPGQITYEKYW